MSEERLAASVDALLDELVGSGAEVGLQIAVMGNRFTPDAFSTAARIDQLIVDELG